MKNLIFCLLFLHLAAIALPQQLNKGQDLLPGQSLTSTNRKYRLTYQPDGNLVIYRNRDNFALWSTKTFGQPAGKCSMQNDGNFVVYKPDGTPIWASVKNWNIPNPCTGKYLIMQDDANAVIYDHNNDPVWSSGTYLEAINEDLQGIPCARGPLPSGEKRTDFKPEIHGFKFANDFIVEIGFAGINARFSGQCGGMAYAALDYYKNRMPIPSQTFRPSTGSVLQSYIYNRQLNSLGDNADKWTELIVNPFGLRTNEFFNWGLQGTNGGRIQELREAIDAGNPVPLGLFKAGNGGGGPHHQVLAIGYDMGRYKGDLGEFKEDFKIFIYDSNHPKETVTLQPHLGNDSFYAYNEYPNEKWQTYFVDKKFKPSVPPTIKTQVMSTKGLVNEICLEIRTGGDDLRGDRDNVHARINFNDGTSQLVENINNSARWIDYYEQTVVLNLDAPRPLDQIKSVTLQTTFGGGINGDNWNIDRIRMLVRGVNREKVVFSRTGAPLVRFTGSNTPFEARFE